MTDQNLIKTKIVTGARVFHEFETGDTVAVDQGGTGATTAADARTNLGAASITDATGSVTIHSDVTDAGSGQIITAAERTLLNSALQLAGSATNNSVPYFSGGDLAEDTSFFYDAGGQTLNVQNLAVNGTLTTIDTTNVTVADAIISLAEGNTTDSVDAGFIIERLTSNVAFFWDESADEFATVTTSSSDVDTSITVTDYANFHCGALVADDSIRSVTGSFLRADGAGNALLLGNGSIESYGDFVFKNAAGSSNFAVVNSTGLSVTGITTTTSYFSANNVGYIRGDTPGELRIQGGSTGTFFRNSGNSAALAVLLESGNFGVATSTPTGRFNVAIAPTTSATTVNEVSDFADKVVIGTNTSGNNGDRIPLVFNIGSNTANSISAAIVGEREASGWNTALSFWINGITSGPEGTDALQEAMRLSSGGALSIGINTAPANRLNVHHATASCSTRFSSGTGGIFFQMSAANGVQAVEYNYGGAGYLDFYDVNLARSVMRLSSGGNIGMGTASPVSNLHVAKGAGGQCYLTLEEDTGRVQIGSQRVSANNALMEFKIDIAGTLSERARISVPAAGETSLWLYDADNATLERVTVGAADSGGTGFKVLRIPN